MIESKCKRCGNKIYVNTNRTKNCKECSEIIFNENLKNQVKRRKIKETLLRYKKKCNLYDIKYIENDELVYRVCESCASKVLIEKFKPKSQVCIYCVEKNDKIRKNNYYLNNLESSKLYFKNRYLNNKEEASARCKRRYLAKRNEVSEYNKIRYMENKDKINDANKKYLKTERGKLARKTARKNWKNKIKSSPELKLRDRVSTAIRQVLGSTKNYNSILDYLPYTMDELKNHIESQFEPWMTWDNWGPFDTNTWDDNDSSTWTWQLDHIIPHSLFLYKSMNDPLLKSCWALSNLRPYSAKQNIMDGATRKRHKKAA